MWADLEGMSAVEEAQEEQSAFKNAAKECKDLRANHSAEFVAQYGERKNAYGKCVSSRAKAKQHAADEQDAEDAADFKNAAKECDDERGDTETTRYAFAEKYGTNKKGSNAFGKCVSGKSHDDKDAADDEVAEGS